jgi:translation initiation factor eIF-2B subunit delta
MINDAITRLASNNTSGASEILRQAGEVFSSLSLQQPGHTRIEEVQKAILETCIALVKAQPDMSPLLRLASVAMSAARRATSEPEALVAVEAAARGFIERAERAVLAAAQNSAGLIRSGITILTHSRSSTIYAAFLEAAKSRKKFAVIATESRPGLEGRALAQDLAAQHIPVTLIADAAASLALDQIDLVLVGADTVTPREVRNKIGTRMICLAAREHGLPVYAVCDTTKLICADYCRRVSNDGGAEELWPGAPPGVSTMNRYFEPTPLGYFAGIITEDGVHSHEEAARRAEAASIDAALLRALETG